MQEPEPERVEWNARDFGNVAHLVLECWGRDEEARGLSKTEAIAEWVTRHVQRNSVVTSDGLACFNGISDAGCEHWYVVTGGGPNSVKTPELQWVNTLLGNVKRSIHGTYHAISPKHLPRYLAEFSYRFNRRFKLAEMLPRLAYIALRTPPMPYRLLKVAEAYG